MIQYNLTVPDSIGHLARDNRGHRGGPAPGRPAAAGRYAVLEHRGAYAELHRAYDWLYRDWLLNSPYQLADAPCLEEYLNDWQQVPPQELRTNIYLPLI